MTAGAVIAYLFTLLINGGKVDITGAFTALLVMQASAYSTLRTGVLRVLAVLCGVLVAILLSTWVGLTWWSLGLAVSSSLLLAKVLRFGDQAIELPISAMLILSLNDPAVGAEARVGITLLGAGVGIGLNLMFPPAMPIRSAVESVRAAAAAISGPLRWAASGFRTGPITRSQLDGWAEDLRTADRRMVTALTAAEALTESRRLNPRAIGTDDLGPVLASGVTTLESCLQAVRALFLVLRNEVPGGESPEDPYGAELREAFAVVFDDIADSIGGFGELVVAEAEHREDEVEQRLDQSLEVLRETKAMLIDLVTVQDPDQSSWLLRGSILAGIEHVLGQLNLEDRARARRDWQAEQANRAHLPGLVEAALPHPELPYSRGLIEVVNALRAEKGASEEPETPSRKRRSGASGLAGLAGAAAAMSPARPADNGEEANQQAEWRLVDELHEAAVKSVQAVRAARRAAREKTVHAAESVVNAAGSTRAAVSARRAKRGHPGKHSKLSKRRSETQSEESEETETLSAAERQSG